MGCFVSTPKDSGGNRRRPGNIGEVSVFVPGFRIPEPVDLSQSLGDHLSKSLVERLSALRTPIVAMAAQEGPTITRTGRRRSPLQHKIQFVWVNHEDDAERYHSRKLTYFFFPEHSPMGINQKYQRAAAYYYHGFILDEGNAEKSHGMAVAALQAADEYLEESKKTRETFNVAPPLSRYPPLWGTMKYLSQKIPKDTSSKVRINRDLYSYEKIMETVPTLPYFALALKPNEFQLPLVHTPLLEQ